MGNILTIYAKKNYYYLFLLYHSLVLWNPSQEDVYSNNYYAILGGLGIFLYGELNNHLAGRHSASVWQPGKRSLVKQREKMQYGEKLWGNLGQLNTQWLWLTASQPQTRSALSSACLKRYVTTSIGSRPLFIGPTLILKCIYVHISNTYVGDKSVVP